VRPDGTISVKRLAVVVPQATFSVELAMAVVLEATSSTTLLEAVEMPLLPESLLPKGLLLLEALQSFLVERVFGILQSSAELTVVSTESMSPLVFRVVGVSESLPELVDPDGVLVKRVIRVGQSLLQLRMPDSIAVARVGGVSKSLMEGPVISLVAQTGVGFRRSSGGNRSSRGDRSRRSRRGCWCHWGSRSGGSNFTSIKLLRIEEAAGVQSQLWDFTSDIRNFGGNIASLDVVLASKERGADWEGDNARRTVSKGGGENSEFSGELHD